MNGRLRFLGQILRNLIYRKSLREVPLVGGTLTRREVALALEYLLSDGRLYKDEAIVRRFESEFARAVGCQYAFAFGAGRVALYAILRALGVQKGDEVILSAFTCVVVPNAIIYTGARPVYVDVSLDTWCIDVSQVAAKITPHTKAIIAQHNFGSFCDMTRLGEIAHAHNIPIIEDCAHALGAWYQGKPAGSFGKAAYFTTEQSKLISTIMGGVATTNDPNIAFVLKTMQENAVSPSHGEIARLALKLLAQYILGNPWNYLWGKYIMGILEHRLGLSTTMEEMQGLMPSRYLRKMSPFQAAIGLQQLKTLPQNLSKRRKIAAIYRQIAQKYRLQTNDLIVNSSEPAYIRYAFLVDDRNRWQEIFRANGIELGEWFNAPIHPMGSSLNAVHYIPGQCPNAEYLAKHVVNLPTHPKVRDFEISKIDKLIGQLVYR